MREHVVQLALPLRHPRPGKRADAAFLPIAEMNAHCAPLVLQLETETAEPQFLLRLLFVRTLGEKGTGRVEPRLMRFGFLQKRQIACPFRRIDTVVNAPETKPPMEIGISRHRRRKCLAAGSRHRFGKAQLEVEIGPEAQGHFSATDRLRRRSVGHVPGPPDESFE